MFACLYQPPAPDQPAASPLLAAVAQAFSPRYERRCDDAVAIDVSGLARLVGAPRVIGEELRRAATARGARVHVALAATQTTALVVALARPGVTVVDPGGEAEALAPIPIGMLARIAERAGSAPPASAPGGHGAGGTSAAAGMAVFKAWGIRTLGELAALPAADLAARLGSRGLAWQALARGDDIRPLVPEAPEERFESTLELDWPIEGLDPLSFVLTRLLEPLSTRLERRDRGAAVLHVALRLATRRPAEGEPHEVHARRLPLPSPVRDVRTLRTLALLDLESHPPGAPIDAVTVVIDPTPGRVLQHTLFARAVPTPDQLSTLLARLGALMGQDRIGAPATVDSYRPGAVAMEPFATDHDPASRPPTPPRPVLEPAAPVLSSSVRRCRRPVPARVTVEAERPVRVTTDRRGFAGGGVVGCAGPWRTSGYWWAGTSGAGARASDRWNRDDWDVALADGVVYRIFRDRETDGWFIDGIVD